MNCIIKRSTYLLIIIFFALKTNAQYVTSISYEGNKKTKESILNNIITLKKEQLLDSVTLNKDCKLLSRLAVCNNADYRVESNESGNYSVTYLFYETNTIIPTISIWTASNEQFAYQLGVKEFNFLGQNKQIGVFYRNNGFHSYSFNYKDPFLFNATTGVEFVIQRLKSLEPVFVKDNKTDYEYSNTSIELLGTKKQSPYHTLKLGVNFFKEEYKVYNISETNVEMPGDTKVDNFMVRTGFEYNKLTYKYQYLNGLKMSFNGQLIFPLKQDWPSYIIAWNDLMYYKTIGLRGNFATRLRVGLASEVNTPFAPFALDNNLNIRGVGNVIDRGTASLVLNAEYRHTLYEKKWFALQSNVFIDAGNWRKPGGELVDIISSKDLEIHPGIGLRFIHKKIYNAVFRLDYGVGIINEKQQGLVFGIGQYF
ncbi:POTRA domain-containing protein [Wenyingzhuangia sp. IMCC45467]